MFRLHCLVDRLSRTSTPAPNAQSPVQPDYAPVFSDDDSSPPPPPPLRTALDFPSRPSRPPKQVKFLLAPPPYRPTPSPRIPIPGTLPPPQPFNPLIRPARIHHCRDTISDYSPPGDHGWRYQTAERFLEADAIITAHELGYVLPKWKKMWQRVERRDPDFTADRRERVRKYRAEERRRWLEREVRVQWQPQQQQKERSKVLAQGQGNDDAVAGPIRLGPATRQSEKTRQGRKEGRDREPETVQRIQRGARQTPHPFARFPVHQYSAHSGDERDDENDTLNEEGWGNEDNEHLGRTLVHRDPKDKKTMARAKGRGKVECILGHARCTKVHEDFFQPPFFGWDDDVEDEVSDVRSWIVSDAGRFCLRYELMPK